MPLYKHILFDLDHTLWDFDANCAETLRELYISHQLDSMASFSVDDFIFVYRKINDGMWAQYHKGIVTKEDIRNKRFEYTFQELGVKKENIPYSINEDFLRICPTKTNLVLYAMDILQYLNDKYVLHILTNGFKESQSIKINSSNMSHFFKEVINSEACGYLKPDRRIFEFTLQKINATCPDCIMIGDDLEADVLGAKNAGIDHIYFNRKKLKHKEQITHEIECLSELKKIL